MKRSGFRPWAGMAVLAGCAVLVTGCAHPKQLREDTSQAVGNATGGSGPASAGHPARFERNDARTNEDGELKPDCRRTRIPEEAPGWVHDPVHEDKSLH